VSLRDHCNVCEELGQTRTKLISSSGAHCFTLLAILPLNYNANTEQNLAETTRG